MIYIKSTKFSHPVLMGENKNLSYKNGVVFKFNNLSIHENTNEFILIIDYMLNSEFLNLQLKNGRAKLLFMVAIKGADNLIIDITNKDKITIPKSEIYFENNTKLQLMLVATNDIAFEYNEDLASFYDEYKKELNIKDGMVLAISNHHSIDNSNRKGYEIFRKEWDKSIKSDIKIELTNECILVKYRKGNLANNNSMLYMYLYVGLTKALLSFIDKYEENDEDDEVELEEIENDLIESMSDLDEKLYKLLLSKGIKLLKKNEIDEVIYKISDDLINKIYNSIYELE